MDIRHSRLLKFFVKDNPKMEKHTLRIENLSPSDIESEVPRHQKIREVTTEPENKPPMPPTKIEPVQNVGQIEWMDLRDMIKKPVFMGLQEEVIRSPHPVRPTGNERDEAIDKRDKTTEESKPQTRIPVARFKPAAERVLKERRDEKSKREAPEKPGRTSIPKLKDRTLVAKPNPPDDKQPVKTESDSVKEANNETPAKTSLKRATRKDKIPVMSKDHYKITKNDDAVKKYMQAEKEDTSKDHTSAINKQDEPLKSEDIGKLDDEFDKLYEEIVDTDAVSVPDEILETKVKDPEKLEIKFEEIVHQYDEPVEQVKFEPVEKARYSKIPLLRRRSSHDVKVPRQFERKLSLKTNNINTATPINDPQATYSTVKKRGKEKQSFSEGSGQLSKDTDNETNQEINNNDENNEEHHIETQSPNPLPDYNTIATPDSELVKVGIFGLSTRNIPFEETNNQSLATPELETVKVAAIELPAEEPPKRSDENIELSEVKLTRLPELIDDTNKPTIDKHKVIDKLIDNVDIANNSNIPNNRENNNDVNDEKDNVTVEIMNEDLVVHNKINHINAPQQNVLIRNPDDELKSYNLLKNTNNVEERTTSRYINKPPKEEETQNYTTKLEEDIPIVKGKVSRILKRLTKHEYPNNELNDNNINKESIDAKKEIDTIPKKKSVLSKIALFERGDLEPLLPKKPTHKYSKPIRTISEEVKHSPKIVQEVLKPKGVPTDKHTIVTVDIIRPVDVLTNNEELVTVVDNLKEETVTYDNFDDSRTNKIETKSGNMIVQEVLKPKGKRTIVTVDIMKPVEVVTNDEQIMVVENLKENIVTFDNFDHARLNQIDRMNEPNIPNVENNKPLLTDVSKKCDKHNDFKLENISDNSEIIKDTKPKDQNFKDVENHYESTPPVLPQRNKDGEHKEKWRSTDALSEFLPVKEKIKRLKSYEDSNLKKAKSTAELDLGDAVKGIVKNMIVRMNSYELLDDVKPKELEVINAKERPRKRSVSEKIALFERKLTPVTMDDVKLENSARALNAHVKPVKENVFNQIPIHKENVNPMPDVNNVNVIPAKEDINSVSAVKENVNVSDEYMAKIRELNNAKLKYGAVSNMSFVQLKDGNKMPVLAIGTALLDPVLAPHIVGAAIDLGYRAIDTAFIYGTEQKVGEGIRAKIQDGTVRREDLFIMNKMWSTYHRPDLVEAACRASLAATGLDYFDLYMIHNPMSFKEGGDAIPKIANVLQYSEYDYLDAWFAMEQLVTKGLVRSIGVSNFNSVQVDRVLEKGRIKPAVNQVECHPYLSQQRLSEFCEARDIRMSCFGVLGSKGTPADFKASQAAAIDDPLVKVMAAGLGITPAQLLIRYQLDSGHAVVVKASTAAHLWDDLQALNTTLQPSQLAALHALNKNKRTFTFVGMGDTHRNYPFKIAF